MHYCKVVRKGVIELEEENIQIENIENKGIQDCEGSEKQLRLYKVLQM
jgi:hypothetical protein